MKQINPEWTDATVGFSWNDAAWFRSYWAISKNTAFNEENKLSYNELTNQVGASDYCGENTYNENCTKVVVKAELVTATNKLFTRPLGIENKAVSFHAVFKFLRK